MKNEAEIRAMITTFQDEIKKLANRPQFNRAEREAVAECTTRYQGKIRLLEWVLEPSEFKSVEVKP